MDKYGYTKSSRPQGKRTVFKDEQDDDVVEVDGKKNGWFEFSEIMLPVQKRADPLNLDNF